MPAEASSGVIDKIVGPSDRGNVTGWSRSAEAGRAAGRPGSSAASMRRLMVAVVTPLPTTRPAPDQWLTLAETAQRLSVPKRWLTENRHQLPFIKTLIAGGAVRVSEAALRRWLATR